MAENFSLSIVTCIWKRDPQLLSRSLSTWVDQTLPPIEIIVSDINPDKDESDRIKKVCDEYDIVTHIHTPIPVFTISRAINIGIKETRGDSDYIACTGSEMIFSRNYFEVIASFMTPNIFTQMVCGALSKEVTMPPHPHDDWDRLASSIDPGSNDNISGGTFLCTGRKWWLDAHGYDEGISFLWPDSDLGRRAILSGLKFKGVPWRVAQAIHQYHEPFLAIAGGRELIDLQADFTVTRNLDGWGERK